jgi:hypothetical protein
MTDDDLLLRIYIGQGIYPTRGMLYNFKGDPLFSETENAVISSLVSKGLVKEINPYSSLNTMRTLVTTDKGTVESKRLIQQILETDSELLAELNAKVSKKVLGFLLINLDINVFEKTWNQRQYFLHWTDFIFNRPRIFKSSLELCRILESHKLAVSTPSYAASQRGRKDEEEYVIPDEVKDYLIKTLNIVPFSSEEVNRANLLYALYKIKNEIWLIKDQERRRSAYWNLLIALPFDESEIKSLISQFQKDSITTEYFEIEKETFLFSILNEIAYDKKLHEMVEAFISEIFEGKKTELRAPLPKSSEFLKNHLKLFVTIGEFEIKFREFLVREMREIYKESEQGWYDRLKEIRVMGNQPTLSTLYDKLESRRKDDREKGISPENELIYYADITDYKDIVLKNWRVFESRFGRVEISKEKFEHGMNELNRIRRKVMHLRVIADFEAETLRLYIIPDLEKIFM